jgi:hypothetical protein
MENESGSFKRGNETDITYMLKWAAWEWLYREARCRSIGFEVKLEGPAGRVIDVVGVGPGNAIYVVEVKGSRSDLFRDDHSLKDKARLASQEPVVEGRRELVEHILQQAAEYARQVSPDNWEDVSAYVEARSEYERVAQQEVSYRERLERYSIKFRDPRFLALADYHYIMAPRGLIRRHEVPPRWGMLDDTPASVVPAPHKEVRKNGGIISNILRAIARANTASMMRHHGVTFSEGEAVFPWGRLE